MFDAAFLHGDLGGRHLPVFGGRRDQHGAGRGARLAHLLVGIGDGARTAGALYAEHQVGIDLVVGRRMDGAHLAPVGIELFGDQRRKAGERSLAEFDVLGEHRHRVVGADLDEGVHRGERWIAPALHAGRCGGEHLGAIAMPMTRPEPARKPRRVALISWIVMAQPSIALAALWIAARMRW